MELEQKRIEGRGVAPKGTLGQAVGGKERRARTARGKRRRSRQKRQKREAARRAPSMRERKNQAIRRRGSQLTKTTAWTRREGRRTRRAEESPLRKRVVARLRQLATAVAAARRVVRRAAGTAP